MRLPPVVIGGTEDALRDVLRFTAPADSVLSRYFREHPRLGGRERGMIAEAIYALLRHRLVYTNFAESGSGPLMRRMALLGLADVAGMDALPGLSEQEVEWLTHVMSIDRSSLPMSMQANLPDWLLARFVRQWGNEEAMQVAESLNRPAPLDLRVNTLKTTRDAANSALTEAGITAEPKPFASLGLRLA